MIEESTLDSRYPYSASGDLSAETLSLTSLRNRSRYLFSGGIWSWLDGVLAYARGLLGNFAILAPVVLATGTLLGVLLDTLTAVRPLLTLSILGILGCIAIVTLVVRANGFPLPDFSHRSPRIAFVLFATVALAEVSSYALTWLRGADVLQNVSSIELLGAIAAFATIAGAVHRATRYASSLRRAILTTSLLCAIVFVVWSSVIVVAEYVYFGMPAHDFALLGPIISIAPLCISVFADCLQNGAAKWWQRLVRLGRAVMVIGVLCYVAYQTITYVHSGSKKADTLLGYSTRPLSRIAEGLGRESDSLPEDLKELSRALQRRKESQDRQSGFFQPSSIANTSFSRWALFQVFGKEDFLFPFKPDNFRNATLLLERVSRLRDLGPNDREQLLIPLSRGSLKSITSALLEKQENAELRQTELKLAFQEAIMRDMITSQLKDDSMSYSKKWDVNSFNRFADKILPPSSVSGEISHKRVPISIADEFLSILGREEESHNYAGKSAPDVLRVGPLVFSPADLKAPNLRISEQRRRRSVFRHIVAMMDQSHVESFVEEHKPIALSLGEDYNRLRRKVTMATEGLDVLIEAAFRDSPEGSSWEAMEVVGQTDSRNRRRRLFGSRASVWDEVDEELARELLIEIALGYWPGNKGSAQFVVGELFKPQVAISLYETAESPEAFERQAQSILESRQRDQFSAANFHLLLASRFASDTPQSSEGLLRRMVYGKFANLDNLATAETQFYGAIRWPKACLVGFIAIATLSFAFLYVDPNSTSLHGFYRDRLARAFLGAGDGDELTRLSDFRDPGNASTAPLHILGAVVNLNGQGDSNLRQRHSVTFEFSPLFVGSDATGFVATNEFERATFDFSLASAIAVSGGALAPNMGRYTEFSVRALLAMANIRLCLWVPNPRHLLGLVESSMSRNLTIEQELAFIVKRRRNAMRLNRCRVSEQVELPNPVRLTIDNQVFGLAISGGGIRSAAIALGITQVLERKGVFADVDLMSTVSGGGFIGGGITKGMGNSGGGVVHRHREPNVDPRRELPQSLRPGSAVFYQELCGLFSADDPWINVSDGGHLENLGVLPLLRRRASVLLICDCEADPFGRCEGLLQLMLLSQLDDGTKFEFSGEAIESMRSNGAVARSTFALGKILYPRDEHRGAVAETGYVLYLKSGVVANEGPFIALYKGAHPDFPHRPTTDQDYGEEEFEAYRRVGEAIAERAITSLFGAIADYPQSSIGVNRFREAIRRALENSSNT